jgi:hypothetical protein
VGLGNSGLSISASSAEAARQRACPGVAAGGQGGGGLRPLYRRPGSGPAGSVAAAGRWVKGGMLQLRCC